MATIQELMPYLEQGFIVVDQARLAYLTPTKQDGVLAFVWKAYRGEGEWSGPDTHTAEHVRTWKSNNWGIECSTYPGWGSYYGEDDPEKIKQAIAEGRAYKAKDFRSKQKNKE